MIRLILSLITIWYDMIYCGEKKEEYRRITPYWVKRFIKKEYWYDDYLNVEYDPENPFEFELVAFQSVRHAFRRGENPFREFDELEFTKGYPKKGDSARRMTKLRPNINVGYGREEWGAEKGRLYFVITWEK